jgi:3-oxoacyl-[acyl-carrier protein] reductase
VAEAVAGFAEGSWSRRLLRSVGLPAAQRLARAQAAYVDEPLAGRWAMLCGTGDGRMSHAVTQALTRAGASLERRGDDAVELAVCVASGIDGVAGLRSLYEFFHEIVPRLAANARVVVVARDAGEAPDSAAAAARRGIEGFVRSLAKELGRRGATANLLTVAAGAEDRLEAPLRFFLSERCAFVSGQPIAISTAAVAPARGPDVRPLAGRNALVTGAAGGLGAATSLRLAEEGARVICADVPAAGAALVAFAQRLGGVALPVDLLAADAPARIADAIAPLGGVDVIVHNAGILRDRTIAKMDAARWDASLAVNLDAILRIDATLDARRLLRDGARVVCLSSIAGIAGNVGQTNYATAKAALIGYVRDRAQRLAARGICVNAVAPGLIETPMMQSMPLLFREVARRMNSLGQAGVPRDVAEVVTFLATPGACGVTGQTLRVCGQNLIGA